MTRKFPKVSPNLSDEPQPPEHDQSLDIEQPQPSEEGPPAVPFETHLIGLPAWQVAALKASTGWPEGKEVSAGDVAKALAAALEEAIS